MNRLLSILLGPEFFWATLYIAFRWLAARNVPPTAAGMRAKTITVPPVIPL